MVTLAIGGTRIPMTANADG
jgi:maltooligosyltrehalose trehalohydrolase